MGFRYRRRIGGKHLWLNLSASQRGVRTSTSARIGRVTANSKGGLWLRIAKGLSYVGKWK